MLPLLADFLVELFGLSRAEPKSTISILKDLGVISAVAAVISATITGVFSVYLKRKSDERIETLKGEISLGLKADSARIDYEYDARKRLYQEVEPVLFAAHLAATSVLGRLSGFPHRIREGHISTNAETTWMHPGYFQRSTVYRLFLPMAHYRLISRPISKLDLTLEPLLGRRFMALAVFEDIFVAHFDLAEAKGFDLPYEPYAQLSEEDKEKNPAKYRFQGLVRGEVEQLISVMIPSETATNPIEWFRFEKELENTKSELHSAYLPLREILTTFHPSTHPVVWRELISFFILSKFFVQGRHLSIEDFDTLIVGEGWRDLDFRSGESHETVSDSVPKAHFEAARSYIRGRLETEYRTLESAGERP